MQLVDGNYFKTILQQRGLSGRSFARMLGIAPSALSRTLNNRREMKTEEAAKIASSLGLSLDEVLRHAGIMEGAAVENTVRVMGRLNGNGEIEVFGESRKPEHVPAPLDMPPNATAVIADTAQSPLELWDGWTFYVGEKFPQPGELVGRQVVAQLDGEKRPRIGWLKRSHRAAHYNLITTGGAGMKGVMVEWAAPVIWIKP